MRVTLDGPVDLVLLQMRPIQLTRSLFHFTRPFYVLPANPRSLQKSYQCMLNGIQFTAAFYGKRPPHLPSRFHLASWCKTQGEDMHRQSSRSVDTLTLSQGHGVSTPLLPFLAILSAQSNP